VDSIDLIIEIDGVYLSVSERPLLAQALVAQSRHFYILAMDEENSTLC
jgi:hypothetical protein